LLVRAKTKTQHTQTQKWVRKPTDLENDIAIIKRHSCITKQNTPLTLLAASSSMAVLMCTLSDM